MRKIFIMIFAVLMLAGCSHIHPYQIDIQQGNVLEQQNVKQLHTGMNKSEVYALLGSPILNNTFDADTWSYVYTNQINGGKIEKKELTLNFKNEKLIKISQ